MKSGPIDVEMVALSPKQAKVLKQYSRFTGKKRNDIIREAIDTFIDCSVVPRLTFYRKGASTGSK